MVTKIVMPQLGISTLEGTITAWLKQEGDTVVKGEPLFEIETDKATMEVESLGSGILKRILVPVGNLAKVTEPVAILADGDENIDETLPEEAVPVAVPQSAPVEQQLEPEQGERSERFRPRISPLARRLADAAEVAPEALTSLKGSGSEGAINKADVLTYLSRKKELKTEAAASTVGPRVGETLAQASGAAERVVPHSRMRRAIAERMTFSTREAPQFWMGTEVGVGALVSLRERINQRLAKRSISLTYTDFLIKAVASALRECPFMNVSYSTSGIVHKSDINVGFAVALDEGLIVPVIRDADRKTLSQIAEDRGRLTENARKGVLSEQDITGGTFTVSNLGMFKVDRFVAILNPPETGILSVGRIRQSLELRDGQVVSTPTMSLGLTIDHRSVDGAQGARFLEQIIDGLEEPCMLLV